MFKVLNDNNKYIHKGGVNKMDFESFSKLTEKEKCVNYEKLSDHDKFLARISTPISVVAVKNEGGNGKLTKEELETLRELEEYSKKIIGK